MGILEHCIASIVYHSSFLRTLLSPNHPLFNTPLFADTTLFNCLQKTVVCIVDDGKQPIRATGIPPHVNNAVQVSKVVEELRTVVPAVVQQVDELLERRAVAAGSITHNGLREVMSGMLQETLAPLISRLEAPKPPLAPTPAPAK